ncbi:YtxH domain-containing protein [Thermosediminibacter oceani]|uniref:YtxH domain-containing protein n=1 Tax=Thermosediminibacter oceani (strain ATCC BAA-1034 / DSM 16646 / JW/IW-1228P) TaxID=555079 RepID=D9S3B9_THEOJ|nr:YtxH domain-containing protein [Thermosediminibacter oceani]ADL07896.1 conserved hypothetical protein [Thermosediminibacter oceani DSM 16646]
MRSGFMGGLFAGILAGTLMTILFGPSSAVRAGKKLSKISRCLKKKTEGMLKKVKDRE